MIAIALVLTVVAGAYAQLPTNCGQQTFQPDLSQRIAGGREAKPHSWPWQVSLRFEGKHKCGGTIIHPNYIITAAQCTYGLNPTKFSIRAGRHTSYGVEPNEQLGTPFKIWHHEDYNEETLDNDITLFRISTPFSFNDYVQPVCLAPSELRTTDTPMYATGWGEVQGTCCEGRLKQAMLHSQTRQYCKINLNSYLSLAQICAGAPLADSPCTGDVGGPLVSKVDGKWELYGVYSYRRGNKCRENGPPVFTNSPYFNSWIVSKITAFEAEEAEVAARGVRLVPYGAAFREQEALRQDVAGVEVVPV